MGETTLDRRRFLQLGGGMGASLLATAAISRLARAATEHRDAKRFSAITPELAATLEAAAARILPTTDTPGAREAGAVWFMDAALGADMAGDLPMIQEGAAALDKQAGGGFASLDDAQQDALLQEVEDSGFFRTVHFLTIAGTFTMPRHGGNRGEVGWDILGFERRHHWEPPFGHYDAAVHSGGNES